MRIRSAGIAALVAAVGLWMTVSSEPATAAKSSSKNISKTTTSKTTTSKATKAGKTARAAKPSARKHVAAADRPMVLAKFKKERRAHAGKKSRTAQARHVKKSASKISPRTFAQKTAAKEAPLRTTESGLPPAVANARAQVLADDEARNIAALDSTDVPIINGMQIAAADQPNDSAPQPAAQDAAPASPPVATPVQPPQNGKIIRAVSSGEKQVLKPADDSDPWSKTSLIGKIFIAFGSLLTLASAARLMIA